MSTTRKFGNWHFTEGRLVTPRRTDHRG